MAFRFAHLDVDAFGGNFARHRLIVGAGLRARACLQLQAATPAARLFCWQSVSLRPELASRMGLPRAVESRDSELTPTAMCRDSGSPPTEKRNTPDVISN